MRRKLIKQGSGQSLAIYLPKQWLDKKNLAPKDEVYIEEKNDSLLISAEKKEKQTFETITINIKNYSNRVIKSLINPAYRQGYEIIKINYTKKEQLEFIKTLTRKTLLGFEIVEETKTYCTLQNITEPAKDKFDIILRKIFILLKNEGKDILEDINTQNSINMEKRKEIKTQIDDYNNFCRRIIFKYKLGGEKNSFNYLVILSRLSLIGHSYYYLCEKLNNKENMNISKDILEYFENTNNLFSQFYTLYFSKDIEKTNNLFNSIDDTREKISLKLIKNTKNENAIITYYLSEIQRLIQVNITNLFGIILEEIKE